MSRLQQQEHSCLHCRATRQLRLQLIASLKKHTCKLAQSGSLAWQHVPLRACQLRQAAGLNVTHHAAACIRANNTRT